MESSVPDFLIIGSPKCGTTALYKQLNEHPDIYMPDNKEPHYFSFVEEGLPGWGMESLENYVDIFSGKRPHQLGGEASTWYLYSHTAAKSIFEHNPKTKLIALLRNPIDRAYSSWNFRVQSGFETTRTFEDALGEEESRISSGCEWDVHYRTAGKYSEQLERYFAYFPKTQIRIILYDEYQSSPLKCIKELFDFLEIDSSFEPETGKRYNRSFNPKSRLLNNFLQKPSVVKLALKSALPGKLRKKITGVVRKKNRRAIKPMLDETRMALKDFYEPEFLKLEEQIGRDLQCWRT